MSATQPRNLLEYFENLVVPGLKKRTWYDWSLVAFCLATGTFGVIAAIITRDWVPLLAPSILNFIAAGCVLAVTSRWWQTKQRVNALLRAIDLEQKREAK